MVLGGLNMNLVLVISILVAAHEFAAEPTACNFCFEDDASACSANQRTQTCAADPDSLGTSHCGYGIGKYKKTIFSKEGIFRGCINCADKKLACFALGGYLKWGKGVTLKECEIECCSDNSCNTGTPSLSSAAIKVFSGTIGQLSCNSCLERDAATCDERQRTQICALSSDALGTSHCGSAAGKYLNGFGNATEEGFIRGCIDCADKQAACAILSGALKASRKWTALQCTIECCTGNKCNDQVPTLPDSSAPAPGDKQVDGPTSQAAAVGEGKHIILFGILTFGSAVANICCKT